MKNELINKIQQIPEFEELQVAIGKTGTTSRKDDGKYAWTVVVESANEFEIQDRFKAIVEKGEDEAIAIPTRQYRLVQMRDLFKDCLEPLKEDVTGSVYYHWGRGHMDVYPKSSEIGLLVRNTVNGQGAVSISFCTDYNGMNIMLPEEMAKGFRRVHKGKNIKVAVKEYVEMLGELQDHWDSLKRTLMSTEATKVDLDNIKDSMKAGKKLSELIDEQVEIVEDDKQASVSLWNVFVDILEAIQKRKYKSDIHKRNKIHSLSESILSYLALNLL